MRLFSGTALSQTGLTVHYKVMEAIDAASGAGPSVSASLLSEYVKTGSSALFDQLIRQHVDFVYAAARRQVRDVHLAQDVTQAVFIVLARRAATVKGERRLAGWLFKTTRYCAANAIKAERRRRRYEQAAAIQRPEAVMPSLPLEADPLLPLLDDAIADLSRSDRDAVLFHYLQGRNMPDLGRALGVSEIAARKRVQRAVERLRKIFAKRGVTVESAIVGSMLSAAGAQAAPAGMAAAVCAATGGAAPPAAAFIAENFLRMIAWTQAKIVAAMAALPLLLIGTLILTARQLIPPSAPPPTTMPAVSGVFTLTVDNKKTGQPLARLPVEIAFDNHNNTRKTDANGVLVIPLPDHQPDYFGLHINQAGYSPVKLEWRNRPAPDPIPAAYALQMEKGTTIGGVVRDKAGQPIVDASVFLIVGKQSPDPHEQSDIYEVQVHTDALGRWRYNRAPETLAFVLVRLSDPGYVSDDLYGNTAPDQDPQNFRNLDHVLVMHKGLAVAGRVTDEAGNPISGAHVKQGADRWGSHYPQVRTNHRGEFKFNQANSGDMTLTVQADGYAPEIQDVVVGGDLGLVTFKLTKGKVLRGRVVDSKGNPIAGVDVLADTWRHKRSISWESKTDDDGRFEWDHAPADPVLFEVLKQGYMSDRRAEFIAGAAEQSVTLRPPLIVRGTVVDAKTGQPLPSFHVICGEGFGDGRTPSWDREVQGKCFGGDYTIKFTEPYDFRFLRIEANGYAPMVSRAIKPDEGIDAPVLLDFKLAQAQGIQALILTPDGKPAAGAQAALAGLSRGLRVDSGRFDQSITQEQPLFSASDDGTISFPPQNEKAIIVVLSDAGYAVMPLDDLSKQSAKQITLSAWSTVDATFKVGSKPFAGEPVCAESILPLQVQATFISFEGHTDTDFAGHAVFQKMPAGRGNIQDWRMRPNGMWGGEVHGYYTATAGQTVQVQAGGVGRRLVGRAIAPPNYNETPDWLHGGQGTLSQVMQEPRVALPYPADWAKIPFDARRAWWQGPEITKFHQEQLALKKQFESAPFRAYFVVFDKDGRFHINDVPSGTYNLNLALQTPWNDPAGGGRQLLSLNQPAAIGPIPGGQSDEPLDLGSLTLRIPITKPPRLNPATTPTPAPGSPADVEQQYQLAMLKGDASAALAYVDTSHPLVESYVRSMAQIAAARHRACDAAIAALGEEDAQKLGFAKDRALPAAYLLSMGWEVVGDHASPTTSIGLFNSGTMVRLDGHWKINLGEIFVLNAMNMAEMNKRSANQIALMEALTDGFKTGKIKSPEEAKAMMMQNQ